MTGAAIALSHFAEPMRVLGQLSIPRYAREYPVPCPEAPTVSPAGENGSNRLDQSP